MKKYLLWTSVRVVLGYAQFNNPPGVPIWCGKAYYANNASFDPGGWIEAPKQSSQPLLDLRVYPRFNIYTDGEQAAELVVDAAISYTTGVPLCDFRGFYSLDSIKAPKLELTVMSNNSAIAISRIGIDTTGNGVWFSLQEFQSQFVAHELEVQATLPGCQSSFKIPTRFTKLPKRTDGGTMSRLDRKTGTLYVEDYSVQPAFQVQQPGVSAVSQINWKPILPYSYYVDWGNWLSNSTARVDEFKSYGFNAIHVIPPGGPQPFNLTQFDAFMTRADELKLWVIYDMRHTYTNLSSLTEQVNRLKSRKSILSWYTADEPDGNSEPLNATRLAYERINQLDPYRPVSLVLNCNNFYFKEYTSGADIIMEDVYPVATNLTFSTQWNTTCNSTYGDCGCDDCTAPAGSIADIRSRISQLKQYQSWLGHSYGPPKALWGVPQAFGGSEYWSRTPDATEETAMSMLRINQGSKGLTAWVWPTTAELANSTGKLAAMLSRDDVSRAILEGTRVAVESNLDSSVVDVAAWHIDRRTLVSVVSITDAGSEGREAVVPIAGTAKSIGTVLWGDGGWTLEGSQLRRSEVRGYAADVFFLN
ncbi:hypothetical protein BT63DRAFT_416572 [Microthyrium microscopicum]|uniref:Glycoside hydrolase n=1 Tax=Microthyrium microscopicum TaxID=703497 RepID=A0A6A6U4V4_9PEZI|nr:hypothetical protein BT63DRAFT_416572 [Microthyrium microscopicum]